MNQYRCFAILLSCLFLSGCGVPDSFKEKAALDSGIYDDAEYREYKKLSEEGALGSNGTYFVPGGDARPAEGPGWNGTVHVTFSDNPFLDVRYFYDAALEVPVDTGSCYLNPGDTIYASTPVSTHNMTNLYRFSEFRLRDCPETGGTSLLSSMTGPEITVPDTYSGKNLSVEAIGAYTDREITFAVNVVDEYGSPTPLEHSAGWSVNNRPVRSVSARVNPLEAYIVRYDYDETLYYFDSSVPACHHNDEADGIAEFPMTESLDPTDFYTVNLRPCVSAYIRISEPGVYSVNDGPERPLAKNTAKTIERLKNGDVISIRSGQRFSCDYDTGHLVAISDLRDTDSGYELRLRVSKGDFEFDPAPYIQREHGTIRFLSNDKEITEKISLTNGQKITYELVRADEGYWLPNQKGRTITVHGEDTALDLDNIAFFPYREVSVFLEQPAAGGTIVYSINGKRISDPVVDTYYGTEIEYQFVPWNGWIVENPDDFGHSYTVTESSRQTLLISKNGFLGFQADHIFRESEEHKPALSVTIDKSVGNEMEFRVSCAGTGPGIGTWEKYTESADWFDKSFKMVQGERIGTQENLILSARNGIIPPGKALKLEIRTSTGGEAAGSSQVRYLQSIPADEEITLYGPTEFASSDVVYQEVDVKISRVDVLKYERRMVPNAFLRVELEDTNHAVISSGAILEGSRKVKVSLVPAPGYYLSGSRVWDGAYEATMQFSTLCSEIDSILASISVSRLCYVTIDTEDAYGICVFKLDGTPLPRGTHGLRADQNLVLDYTLTDPRYQIVRGPGIGDAISDIFSKSMKSVTIPITPDLEGEVLQRAQFIHIIKEGD